MTKTPVPVAVPVAVPVSVPHKAAVPAPPVHTTVAEVRGSRVSRPPATHARALYLRAPLRDMPVICAHTICRVDDAQVVDPGALRPRP